MTSRADGPERQQAGAGRSRPAGRRSDLTAAAAAAVIVGLGFAGARALFGAASPEPSPGLAVAWLAIGLAAYPLWAALRSALRRPRRLDGRQR
jgi:hypothetical protein